MHPVTAEQTASTTEAGDGIDGVVDGALVPRRPKRLLLRLAIALVILAALAVAGRRYYDELGRLRSASPWLVAAMALLYVAGRWPAAEVMRASLRSLGHAIGRVETFFLLMVQYYVNMLIPRAGIGALAGYLKLRRGIPVADLGAAQVLTLTLAQYACLGAAALICQLALAAAGVARFDPILASVFAGVSLACFAPLLLPLSKLATYAGGHHAPGVLTRFLARLADAAGRLGRDRRLIARAFALHGVVLLLRAARVQLSFKAVGADVGFWPAFVASAVADVMFLVSITPGALGFREGGMVYAAGVLGTTGDVALAAALLDRIVLTGCNLVLGQLGMWRYIGRTGSVQREEV